jgi:hypothetical protein
MSQMSSDRGASRFRDDRAHNPVVDCPGLDCPGLDCPGLDGRVLSLGAAVALLLVCLVFCPAVLFSQVPVPTYHADYTRSGLYDAETLLTPANVNSTQFGKLFYYNVDGFVVAQPLYMPNVTIDSSVHNVVYVVTQNDSVYAFDADNLSSAPLWQASLINASAGVTTVPIAQQGCPSTGYTQTGIMGTPVISAATGTIYLVAKTKEVSGSTTNYVFRLHALDITTGLEQLGGPLVINASIIAPDGNTVTFQPREVMQRAALLLENDVLYIGFGSNGCDFSAQGWLFAFDSGIASGTLQQLAVMNTDPDESYGASIWQSGGGPASDGNGNVFFSTANGTFDFSTGGPDLGDSVLRTSYAGGTLSIDDYFTPYDQANMAAKDLDLGSGGPLVLLSQPGPYPNLLVAAGKTGTIYVLNQANLGTYNPLNNDQIVQSLPSAIGPFYSTPVYWNSSVYFAGNADYVKEFSLTNGLLSTSPTALSKATTSGGTPVISANGNNNGVLWMVNNPANPQLLGMSATTLTSLYSSSTVASRDTLGATAHFATPIVANGRVYVGTQTQLVAYGLLPALAGAGGGGQSAPVTTTLPQQLQIQALNSLRAPVPGVAVSFSDGGAGGTFGNPTATTNSSGTASTSYTMPKKAGNVSITASASTYVSTALTVTAVAGPPASIGLLSGGGQSGTVATQLAAPAVVRLEDVYGNLVSGIPVQFTDNGAGGSFSANPVLTGVSGTASVSYTLPTVAKVLSLSATYSTLKVNFGETSVAGTPTTLKIGSGSGQSAQPNTQLPKPLVLLLSDQYGNPVSGVGVTFSDNGAAGTFSADPVTTIRGQASVNYTTGSQAGAVIITASVPGANTATLHETVQ